MKLLLTSRGRVSCVFPDTPSLICGFGGSLKSVISIGFLFLSIWFIKYLLRVMVISCVKIALGSCLIVTITTQKNPETYLKVAEIWEGWYFECSKHGWPKRFILQPGRLLWIVRLCAKDTTCSLQALRISEMSFGFSLDGNWTLTSKNHWSITASEVMEWKGKRGSHYLPSSLHHWILQDSNHLLSYQCRPK